MLVRPISYSVSEIYKKSIKQSLSVDSHKLSLEEISVSTMGRLAIEIGTHLYECFLKKNSNKHLFVFISTNFDASKYPIFQRINWLPFLDGVCLYITDPLSKKYGHLTHYLGNSSTNTVLDIHSIVNKIKELYSLGDCDITFVGDSNAAFGIAKISHCYNGSSFFLLNPQFSIPLWYANSDNSVKSYEKDFNVNFQKDTKRVIATELCNCRDNNFFVYFNISSSRDLEQYYKLCEIIDSDVDDLKESFVFQQLNKNITLFRVRIKSEQPHIIYPDEYMMCIMMDLFYNRELLSLKNMCWSFFNLLNKNTYLTSILKEEQRKNILNRAEIYLHFSNIGWFKSFLNTCTSAFKGIKENQQIESIRIITPKECDFTIHYRVYQKTIGWMHSNSKEGKATGLTGKHLPITGCSFCVDQSDMYGLAYRLLFSNGTMSNFLGNNEEFLMDTEMINRGITISGLTLLMSQNKKIN